jgi:hypothetical protein
VETEEEDQELKNKKTTKRSSRSLVLCFCFRGEHLGVPLFFKFVL